MVRACLHGGTFWIHSHDDIPCCTVHLFCINVPTGGRGRQAVLRGAATASSSCLPVSLPPVPFLSPSPFLNDKRGRNRTACGTTPPSTAPTHLHVTNAPRGLRFIRLIHTARTCLLDHLVGQDALYLVCVTYLLSATELVTVGAARLKSTWGDIRHSGHDVGFVHLSCHFPGVLRHACTNAYIRAKQRHARPRSAFRCCHPHFLAGMWRRSFCRAYHRALPAIRARLPRHAVALGGSSGMRADISMAWRMNVCKRGTPRRLRAGIA